MIWMFFALISAVLLGLYEICKKKALNGNAVVPVLLLNTFFSTMLFLPLYLFSQIGFIDENAFVYVAPQSWEQHGYIFIKSSLVLLSWIFAYFGLKHLPITIVAPINAMRPVGVLLGAITIFGEKLSLMQWIGVVLAIISFYMLSRSGKKEGIDFRKNKWIAFVVLANVVGALCGLYDKFLMAKPVDGGIGVGFLSVLVWYNFYQLLLMSMIFLIFRMFKKEEIRGFYWKKEIVFISLFLSAAEITYFMSFGFEGVMISIVSLIRRCSVVISFVFGAWLFREKNIKSKARDLILILISMLFLFLA